MTGPPANDAILSKILLATLSVEGFSTMHGSVMKSANEVGFTLLELAIVVALVGLLAGGGLLVANGVQQRMMRADAATYMQEVKRALLAYASVNGRLPYADIDGDGRGDYPQLRGNLPFAEVGVKPLDPWGRTLKYEAHSRLKDSTIQANGKTKSCDELWTGLTVLPGFTSPFGLQGRPFVTDDCPPKAWPVYYSKAFVIVSAGGSVFDGITACGDNSLATPSMYVRHPRTDTFDDLVVYAREPEVFEAMKCGTPNTPQQP